MTDPLAPDVLAEFDRTTDPDSELEWLMENAPALLAVARDHARLTAEVTAEVVERLSDTERAGWDVANRLTAEAVPDGHTRIGGKLFRLERHGDLNRYGLVRVRPEENPDV